MNNRSRGLSTYKTALARVANDAIAAVYDPNRSYCSNPESHSRPDLRRAWDSAYRAEYYKVRQAKEVRFLQTIALIDNEIVASALIELFDLVQLKEVR